jgi:hypothetical protein
MTLDMRTMYAYCVQRTQHSDERTRSEDRPSPGVRLSRTFAVQGHLFPDADAGIAGRLDDMLDSGAAHQRPKPESAEAADIAQARKKPR